MRENAKPLGLVDTGDMVSYTAPIEVQLTPEQEAELSQLANRQGRDVSTLAREILSLYLRQEARFVEAVKRGIAFAERGDFVEHDEVLARIDRLLQT
jgi:predicted transcriptional regulator